LFKKKKLIDLSGLKITYEEKDLFIQVLSLSTLKMTVDLKVKDKNNSIENKTIPFAHLPKSIKKLVKPV